MKSKYILSAKKKIFHPNLDKQKKSPLVLQKNPPKEFDSHTNPLCTKIMQLTQNRYKNCGTLKCATLFQK